MSNHPKRRKARRATRYPDPGEIRVAREVAGLSQTAAAELVHAACRTWQQWEAGDRRMHPAFWDLFCLKSAALIASI